MRSTSSSQRPAPFDEFPRRNLQIRCCCSSFRFGWSPFRWRIGLVRANRDPWEVQERSGSASLRTWFWAKDWVLNAYRASEVQKWAILGTIELTSLRRFSFVVAAFFLLAW
ncbi:hypothetical protein MUK42_01897 [Musa troglodytarum]|uniref:Uncharacterized protein n=1 Tax=Musa troglodytarum TaxID=320322 RepID=A0A9E7FET6_9LILI|nr:hypothetical protein MUK42_01897 [Musa troglodytarum]